MQAPPLIVLLTAATVMIAWLSALGIGAVQEDWTPLTIVTPVMLLLAGYAFGVSVVKRQKGNGDK